MKLEKYFSKQEQLDIESAVKEAELNTSGEIRVHVEEKLAGDPLDRAAYIFEKLNMHRTSLRNGVLFYLAMESHKFGILGDAGINAKVPENFWDNIREKMQESFAFGNYTQGLITGIILAGEQLKKHFPFQKDDINELSDKISTGN
jgi:uncharacterized membrane protein